MTRDFLHLFRGNPAAVGLDDAGHGRPGPLRLDNPLDREQKWHALVDGHLAGLAGIGVYPVRDGKVVWGCVDFDEGEVESWSHALNVKELLSDLDVTTWIERSRSKGYHVWLFSGDWLTAKWMRQLLLGACSAVEAPGKEVNPKSEELGDGQLGNFVRLPYFGALAGTITRQVVVGPGGEPIPLGQFVDDALERSVTADRVVRVAKLLYAPPRVTPLRRGPGAPAGPWLDRLNPLAVRQLEEGPKADSSDRSAYLMAFGHACAESGLDEEEIRKAVRVADLRHTHKYETRRDADVRYGDIAAKAIRREMEVTESW